MPEIENFVEKINVDAAISNTKDSPKMDEPCMGTNLNPAHKGRTVSPKPVPHPSTLDLTTLLKIEGVLEILINGQLWKDGATFTAEEIKIVYDYHRSYKERFGEISLEAV